MMTRKRPVSPTPALHGTARLLRVSILFLVVIGSSATLLVSAVQSLSMLAHASAPR